MALKKVQPAKIIKQLAYVEGKNYNDYLSDMKIIQRFAVLNRKAIIDEIIKGEAHDESGSGRTE